MNRIRVQWILLLMIVALLGSPYFLWDFYYKYNISPTSRKRIRRPLNTTPFPAITICNLNKVKKSFYESLSREDDFKRLFIMDSLYNINQTVEVSDEARKKASQWGHYYNFQEQASQNCSNMIAYCGWFSKRIDCRKWFKPVLTNKGLCCGFNIAYQVIDSGKGRAIEDWPMEHYNDWTPETEFKIRDRFFAIPRRVPSNVTSGLVLKLFANTDEYFCLQSNCTVGFEVMIHNPIEIPPFARKNNVAAYPGWTTNVRLYPMVIEADQGFSKLDLDVRQCYALNERKLRFYRIYTLNNCELDCLANYAIEFCGCLPKHIPVDFNVKICGKAEKQCLASMPSDYKESCKCYEGCSVLGYGGKVYLRKWADNSSSDYEKNNMAYVYLYYGQDTYLKNITIINDEFTRWSFYANVSWGCFTGAIVIIIFKIIHFHRADILPALL